MDLAASDAVNKEVVTVTCEGCNAQETGQRNDLFFAGWDLPPYFADVFTCPACPSAPIFLAKLNEQEST